MPKRMPLLFSTRGHVSAMPGLTPNHQVMEVTLPPGRVRVRVITASDNGLRHYPLPSDLVSNLFRGEDLIL